MGSMVCLSHVEKFGLAFAACRCHRPADHAVCFCSLARCPPLHKSGALSTGSGPQNHTACFRTIWHGAAPSPRAGAQREPARRLLFCPQPSFSLFCPADSLPTSLCAWGRACSLAACCTGECAGPQQAQRPACASAASQGPAACAPSPTPALLCFSRIRIVGLAPGASNFLIFCAIVICEGLAGTLRVKGMMCRCMHPPTLSASLCHLCPFHSSQAKVSV